MAIRQGDFKLVRYDMNADTQTGAKQPVTSVKLYNLRDDVNETKDLAAAEPGQVKELQSKWDVWNSSNVRPLWGAGSREDSDNNGPEPGNKPNPNNRKRATPR